MSRPSGGLALLFIGLLVTLPLACARDDSPGAPGGQAAAKIADRGGIVTPSPVEIWQDGRLIHVLRWEELQSLQTVSFNTGLADEQTGHLLADALRHVGADEGKTVSLYGRGMNEPLKLSWNVIENPANQIVIGVTHKNTVKVVAGNFEFMNRDRWVRH
ncbi:MAG: hypothetical protein AB1515_07030, partial [Nitrospirota bacterium]